MSFEMLRDSLHSYQKAVKAVKAKYLSAIIENNCHRPRVLFNTINSVINPSNSIGPEISMEACENCMSFFVSKIENIRSQIPPLAGYPAASSCCPAVFHRFELLQLSTLAKMVDQLKPSDSPLDVVPSRLIKQTFDVVGPSILSIINSCLASGIVPASFKHAVVQPLIKNTKLNPTDYANYRPISKLPFLSKVLEKAVLIQLQSFLNNNYLFEVFQSGFREHHNTESALLKVLNYILLAVDSGDTSILVLIDLSAAFDTIDHEILIARLERVVEIRGTVLNWFKSYLTNRSFSVTLVKFSSSLASLTCGIPQRSILGPILFSLYMLPIGSIFSKHGVSFHCYADDTQIYVPVKKKGNFLEPLLACLKDFKTWLAVNFLHLNESKTETIVFAPSSASGSINIDLGPLSIYGKSMVKKN